LSTLSSSPAIDTAPTAPAPALDAPPDWSQITEDIVCPLCEYNLRGLSTPRCPECGYRFAWPELLDWRLKRHPYLFEHQDKRRIRAYLCTLAGGLRPRKFWRSLHPMQASRPLRLLAYWFLGAILFTILTSVEMTLEFAWMWRAQMPTWRGAPAFYRNADILDWSWMYWRRGYAFAEIPPIALPPLLFPWLVFLALLVFQITMRRQRIRTHHMARCALYAYDPAILALILLLKPLFVFLSSLGTGTVSRTSEEGYFALALVALVLFAYRLQRAIALYLRFHRPLATTMAAQVVALLAFLNLLLLYAIGWRW